MSRKRSLEEELEPSPTYSPILLPTTQGLDMNLQNMPQTAVSVLESVNDQASPSIIKIDEEEEEEEEEDEEEEDEAIEHADEEGSPVDRKAAKKMQKKEAKKAAKYQAKLEAKKLAKAKELKKKQVSVSSNSDTPSSFINENYNDEVSYSPIVTAPQSPAAIVEVAKPSGN